MLKSISEFRKHLVITGFRNVEIKDTDRFLKTINEERPSRAVAQVFNAELVATWEHLYFAALNALQAMRNNERISNSLAMETMLYASTQRQIRRATSILGIKTGSDVALLVIGEDTGTMKSALSWISKEIKAIEDETVLELTDEKAVKIQGIYRISDEEIKTATRGHGTKEGLVSCIIERMSLLVTQR